MQSSRRGPSSLILLSFLAVALVLLGIRVFRDVQPPSEAAAGPPLSTITVEEAKKADLSLREALYYHRLEDGRIQCDLCPSRCILRPGERGVCKVRAFLLEKLVTLVYARPVSAHGYDPIEKKPLFHFLPRSRTFSIATVGCNLECIFCQNWEISQAFPEHNPRRYFSPEEVVQAALESGCRSIAYTYTEPTVFYEYMLDTAKLAKEAGLKNVWVTCGYINPEPLREFCKVLHGANVDLKGFTDEFYLRYCHAKLGPVLQTLKILKEEGVWFEITNLLVPGANDNPEEIRSMCQWIRKELGVEVPLHFSRFFPQYKLTQLSPTPKETLLMAYDIAREEGLKFVYTGNYRGLRGENTYCPKCGETLIGRNVYIIWKMEVRGERCPACGEPIPGVWE